MNTRAPSHRIITKMFEVMLVAIAQGAGDIIHRARKHADIGKQVVMCGTIIIRNSALFKFNQCLTR